MSDMCLSVGRGFLPRCAHVNEAKVLADVKPTSQSTDRDSWCLLLVNFTDQVNVCVCVCVWVCVCGCGWLQDLLEKCDQEFRSDDGVKQSKSVKYSNIFIRS